ncbi:MAG TPA: aspartate/glutamate racemase family protein [Vicinamibacterales bacterium]|nr:aspartate/glutamate racemase family protein [Vicinamibacterales bacterium]
MKILYQIPGNVSGGPLGGGELERRRSLLQAWAAAGTEVAVADTPGGPLSIESHAEEALCVPPMIDAIARRQPPPDAVIVGCFGDPGLAALRELLDVPVVGPLEASFHLAAQLGARVGIVTVLDSVIPLLDGLVRSMGQTLRYAGAVAIDLPVLDVTRRAADAAGRLVEAGGTLLRQRHADVLVLGCMSLAFLDLAPRVSHELGVPVVNPAKVALKTAEVLVTQGLLQSRRTYPKPRKGLPTASGT